MVCPVLFMDKVPVYLVACKLLITKYSQMGLISLLGKRHIELHGLLDWPNYKFFFFPLPIFWVHNKLIFLIITYIFLN